MIDFELRPEIKTSETQRMVYEAARDFAAQFIKPNVMDWDEAQYFPVRAAFPRMRSRRNRYRRRRGRAPDRFWRQPLIRSLVITNHSE